MFGKRLRHINNNTNTIKMTPKKEDNKKEMTPEECPNCKEQVLVYEKAVEKKIDGETLRFCSEACATAYKEAKKTREDETGTKEGKKTILPMARSY
jgi:DNA-directed RNA polymerase subunit M/transcription elongation factor TFIIS